MHKFRSAVVHHLEQKLQVDIDGDGAIGKPGSGSKPPRPNQSGYGAPNSNLSSGQNQYGAPYGQQQQQHGAYNQPGGYSPPAASPYGSTGGGLDPNKPMGAQTGFANIASAAIVQNALQGNQGYPGAGGAGFGQPAAPSPGQPVYPSGGMGGAPSSGLGYPPMGTTPGAGNLGYPMAGSPGVQPFGTQPGNPYAQQTPPAVPQASSASYGLAGWGGAPSGGQKKALLVGCNYTGSPNQLNGCVNDVKRIREFLTQHGWPHQNINILVDDRSWGTQMPTRANMINAINQFAGGARPGDSLFFHFSGHGGKVRDTSGDEDDGMDETIMPCDFRTAGQIVDDELYQRLVAPLPKGANLFALMDCCNSGTGLDLPYRFVGDDGAMGNIFRSDGSLNSSAIPSMLFNQKWTKKNLMKAGKKMMSAALKAQMQDGKRTSFGGVVKAMGGGNSNGFASESQNTVRAHVVAIGGCEDMKTSADVSGPSGAGGACTNAFVATLTRNPRCTYIELLEGIRQEIKRRGLKQRPQLSAGEQIGMGEAIRLTA